MLAPMMSGAFQCKLARWAVAWCLVHKPSQACIAQDVLNTADAQTGHVQVSWRHLSACNLHQLVLAKKPSLEYLWDVNMRSVPSEVAIGQRLLGAGQTYVMRTPYLHKVCASRRAPASIWLA